MEGNNPPADDKLFRTYIEAVEKSRMSHSTFMTTLPFGIAFINHRYLVSSKLPPTSFLFKHLQVGSRTRLPILLSQWFSAAFISFGYTMRHNQTTTREHFEREGYTWPLTEEQRKYIIAMRHTKTLEQVEGRIAEFKEQQNAILGQSTNHDDPHTRNRDSETSTSMQNAGGSNDDERFGSYNRRRFDEPTTNQPEMSNTVPPPTENNQNQDPYVLNDPYANPQKPAEPEFKTWGQITGK